MYNILCCIKITYQKTNISRIQIWQPANTACLSVDSNTRTAFHFVSVFTYVFTVDLPSILFDRSTGRQPMKSRYRLTPDTDFEDPGTTMRAGSSSLTRSCRLVLRLLAGKEQKFIIRQEVLIIKTSNAICVSQSKDLLLNKALTEVHINISHCI